MIDHDLPKGSHPVDDGSTRKDRLENYLADLMSGLKGRHRVIRTTDNLHATPQSVFDILTNREFCYLSKARVNPYREDALALIQASLYRSEPICFYFDIGGGYHASLVPREQALSFDVGLAELFVLSQISRFAARISTIYLPGVRFSLVIDNLCALMINDIPLKRTEGYCAKLRALIHETGLDRMVNVIVESEHFCAADVNRLSSSAPTQHEAVPLTKKQHENVERFLGRPCDESEASVRFATYKHVIEASELLLASLIHGVHMTQRATESTICFRPFPGGDSRIQCGEVALSRNNKDMLHPILLTSSNVGTYRITKYRFSDILPSVIEYATYAEPRRKPQASVSSARVVDL